MNSGPDGCTSQRKRELSFDSHCSSARTSDFYGKGANPRTCFSSKNTETDERRVEESTVLDGVSSGPANLVSPHLCLLLLLANHGEQRGPLPSEVRFSTTG